MNFFVIIFSSFLSTIFGYLRQKFTYWEFLEVKQLKTHFLFGNFFKLKTVHYSALLQDVYDAFKGKVRVAGTYVYTDPVAVVLDTQLAKNVLITDEDKFIQQPEQLNPHSTLEENSSAWDDVMSTENMDSMVKKIWRVSENLDASVEATSGEFDVQDLAQRFISDCVGTSVYALECNSLENPADEFYNNSTTLLKQSFGVRVYLLLDTYPLLQKLLRIRGADYHTQAYLRTLTDQSLEVCKRKESLAETLTSSSKLRQEQANKLLYNLFVLAQANCGSKISQLLFELAKDPKRQDKLRKEIEKNSQRPTEDLTLEDVLGMTFLQQAVNETLRLYPCQASLTRQVTCEYAVPDTKITIDKGTRIVIPIKAILGDAELYKNPLEFQPERFAIHQTKDELLADASLGWGTAPRQAPATKYLRLLISVGVITLLRRYRFSLSPKSCKTINPKREYVTLMPSTEIWLKAEPIK